jgi:hypothetical protein
MRRSHMSRRITLLARVIRGYLDFAFYALLVVGVALLIMTPFVIASAPGIEDADIKVAVRFIIDQGALAGSSPRSDDVVPSLVQGQGDLRVRSQSRVVWAWFLISALLVLAVWLLVLHQLRALLRSVAGGTPFAPENPGRIKTVGWVAIAWQTVVPLAKYLVGCPLAKYLVGWVLVGELAIRGITLKPPIDFNPDALFLGMAILVLAEIFRQASELQREQSLTV